MRAGAVGLAALALLASGCGDAGSQEPALSVVGTPAGDDGAPRSVIDIQGHRGARGLRPENTLPAFEAALDLEVDTLELDLHFTADGVVVVWHDPVVSADKCDVASDIEVSAATAADLRALTCDRNPDPGRFAEQMALAGSVAGDDYGIVSLEELFDFVDGYASSDSKTNEQADSAGQVRFNVETKRKPDDPSAIGDGFDGTSAGPFEAALVDLIVERRLEDRVTIQSFDHRSLWAVRGVNDVIELVALTRRGDIPDFADLAARGAMVWSPDYRSVSANTLAAAKAEDLRVVPWTVNDLEDMEELIALGVDGLITDRPDLAVATR